jgi:hypothetical protein
MWPIDQAARMMGDTHDPVLDDLRALEYRGRHI